MGKPPNNNKQTKKAPTPPQSIVDLEIGISIEAHSRVGRLDTEFGHETDLRYEESKYQPGGVSHKVFP